jgi:hypothetical protein
MYIDGRLFLMHKFSYFCLIHLNANRYERMRDQERNDSGNWEKLKLKSG